MNNRGYLRVVLPDGRLRLPVLELLRASEVCIHGYDDSTVLKPCIDLPGVSVTVIKARDIAAQVGCGNFDLGITGLDWLLDQYLAFPSICPRSTLDLHCGQVTLVAAVHRSLEITRIEEIEVVLRHQKPQGWQVRIASKYSNIAREYLRLYGISPYLLSQVSGAVEAFPPEDADLVIDNVETGVTLASNDLKVVDTLLVSTAHLVVNLDTWSSCGRRYLANMIVRAFQCSIRDLHGRYTKQSKGSSFSIPDDLYLQPRLSSSLRGPPR